MEKILIVATPSIEIIVFKASISRPWYCHDMSIHSWFVNHDSRQSKGWQPCYWHCFFFHGMIRNKYKGVAFSSLVMSSPPSPTRNSGSWNLTTSAEHKFWKDYNTGFQKLNFLIVSEIFAIFFDRSMWSEFWERGKLNPHSFFAHLMSFRSYTTSLGSYFLFGNYQGMCQNFVLGDFFFFFFTCLKLTYLDV